MSPPIDTPPEIADEIVSHRDNDDSTVLSCRAVCKAWSLLRMNPFFVVLTLKSWQDIRDFVEITSTSYTFPNPIRNEKLILTNLTAIGARATAALQDLVSTITPQESLAIHVITGGVAQILSSVSQGWNNIRQLDLSGGIHAPAALSAALASFCQLKSLSFREFRMKELEGVGKGVPAVQFRLPSTLTKLSLVRSASLWTFFRVHVLPGHGMAELDELCIEELFCFAEEGVEDMMHAIRLQELRGIPTIRLRPIYEESAFSDFRDINRDFKRIFHACRLHFVRIPELERLFFHFDRIPAELTLGSVIMHAIFLPSTSVGHGVAVEFEATRSLSLWDNADPASQMSQLVQGAQSDTPVAVTASLAVRVAFEFLPDAVRLDGTAMVCGYPVGFVGFDEE